MRYGCVMNVPPDLPLPPCNVMLVTFPVGVHYSHNRKAVP